MRAPASKLIAVDADGKRIALDGLTYSWVREDTTYQWYQENGAWKYQAVTRDRLITSGQGRHRRGRAGQAGADAALWLLSPDDHRSGIGRVVVLPLLFRLGGELGRRPARPHSGRGRQADLQAPARPRMCSIKPTANGKALVVVAGDRVFSSKLIDAPAGGTSVDIPVSADWGAGAYVLVTDYRPLNELDGPRAGARHRRWPGSRSTIRARTLTPIIGGPAKILPRQKITIPVTIKGLGEWRGGLSDAGRGGRGHPAAHQFQVARSDRLLFRQAPARRRHARRLRPPDQAREGRGRRDARRRRQFRRPPARRGADADRGAVLRAGEGRARRAGECHARRAGLQRRTAPDGGGGDARTRSAMPTGR